jgi:ubiquinone/menaquinone biosynthesis C-methylase UbiE
MESLPYPDEFFDALISIQVIHHNRLADIKQTASEITRVVKPGGLIWVTVPVSKNEPSQHQEEIEPGTFVPLDGPEKRLPHRYFREAEIPPLFGSFEVLKLGIDDANHYSLMAQKNE